MIDSFITLVSLDSIVVGSRQRSELKKEKVLSLAEDIASRDLIHCPVVDSSSHVLVVGAHRLAAFKLNRDNAVPCPNPDYQDWSLIPIRLASNATPNELAAIELVENLKRTDLPWQDEARAILRIHEIHVADSPEWTGNATAAALNLSSAYISQALTVARELAAGNPKIEKASSIRSAYGVIERGWSRAMAAEIEDMESVLADTIPAVIPTSPVEAGITHERAPEEAASAAASDPSAHSAAPVTPPPPVVIPASQSILHADFIQWLQSYSGPKFNFLHCDFPYGINYQDAQQGNVDGWGAYDDSPEVFWTLCDALTTNLDRILMKSAHIMFWYSYNYDKQLRDYFAETLPADCIVQNFPMIWHKSDNKGLLPDPNRYGRRTYEVALLITRGDRKVVKPVALSYPGPTAKSGHLSEKPIPMLKHFFQMFVDDSTRMLDPTCGSGNALHAAEELSAGHVLGLELDEENVSIARDDLQVARNKAALARRLMK